MLYFDPLMMNRFHKSHISYFAIVCSVNAVDDEILNRLGTNEKVGLAFKLLSN